MSYVRPILPPVTTAGYFAVPNPDNPAVITCWSVDDDGELHRFPPGTRWEPRCPAFTELGRADRPAARTRWYDEVYFVWKRIVISAINADPDAARRAFAHRHPQVVARAQRAEQERAEREQRQQADELLAAVWSQRGKSVAAISREQGCAWETASNRIAAGRLAWAQDPAAARQLLVDHYGRVVDEATLDALIAPLVATGKRIGGAR